MILTWKMRKKFVAATVVTIFVSMFFLEGNQRQSHAAINPDLGNLGSEIVCFVFTQLNGVGSPIPVLNAGDCQNPPNEPPQCVDGIDNDGDGLVDFPADLGCTSASDNTEAPNPTTPPPPPPPPPPASLCSDEIDNDSDGKIDLADPGCSGPTDNDETDSPPSGGGSTTTPPIDTPPSQDTGGRGSGGRSGSGSSRPATPIQGQVLGVETCQEYLLEYIKFGAKNTSNEVSKLQRFLRDLGGFANLKETGIYDATTLAAVHAFQKTNAAQILTPWGATRSTGYVYYTTKKTINEIYCKFIRKFPLTSQQEAEIVRVKASGQGWRIPNPSPLVPLVVPKNTKPTNPTSPPSEKPEVGNSQTSAEQSAAVETSVDSVPAQGWFNSVLNWFRGR